MFHRHHKNNENDIVAKNIIYRNMRWASDQVNGGGIVLVSSLMTNDTLILLLAAAKTREPDLSLIQLLSSQEFPRAIHVIINKLSLAHRLHECLSSKISIEQKYIESPNRRVTTLQLIFHDDSGHLDKRTLLRALYQVDPSAVCESFVRMGNEHTPIEKCTHIAQVIIPHTRGVV